MYITGPNVEYPSTGMRGIVNSIFQNLDHLSCSNLADRNSTFHAVDDEANLLIYDCLSRNFSKTKE